MFLNGIDGGLVGITAGADQMSPNEAVIIGLLAGIIIVFGVALIDSLKLDDCRCICVPWSRYLGYISCWYLWCIS